MTGERKRRRLSLFQRDPHCHWCGRLTRYDYVPGVKTQPPDLATIDHLDNRRKRGDKRERERSSIPDVVPGERTVLACRECNERRAVNPDPRFNAKKRRANAP